MGLTTTLTRTIRVFNDPEIPVEYDGGILNVTAISEDISAQGFELMEMFFNALDGYDIKSDGHSNEVSWKEIQRFWLALWEWRDLEEVDQYLSGNDPSPELRDVNRFIERMAPWMGQGPDFHEKFGISKTPLGVMEPYGWTEFSYRGSR